MNGRIRIAQPMLDARAEELVLEVLRSGRIAQGPKVDALEAQFAQLVGVRHAIAVSSGTAALEAALQLVTSQRGPLTVVTSPFTFVATLNAILATGSTVRFADIGPDFNVDTESLRDRGKGAEVVLPVHLYGLMCDMDSITKSAPDDSTIIEDAAQAVGAMDQGRPAGSFGIGCFSLYATKNVTSGEGGVITTDDDESAVWLRRYINHGMTDRYDYRFPGRNLRLTDIQAAIALPQLDDLDHHTNRRRENARFYNDALRGIDALQLPAIPTGLRHVWHQYTVRVPSHSRRRLIRHLDVLGIDSGVYYPRPVFDYGAFQQHPQIDVAPVPNATRASAEVLSIPVHPGLTECDRQRVVAAIREFFHA